jgi:hypothetical protein
VRTPAKPFINLPAPCPEPGCGCYLQRGQDPALGVRPHYSLLHPETIAPTVLFQGLKT